MFLKEVPATQFNMIHKDNCTIKIINVRTSLFSFDRALKSTHKNSLFYYNSRLLTITTTTSQQWPWLCGAGDGCGCFVHKYNAEYSIHTWHDQFWNWPTLLVQCPLLTRITLGHHKSDNINRMIQFTAVFCVLFCYNGTSRIWRPQAADSIAHDTIKRRALYFSSLKQFFWFRFLETSYNT